MQVHASPDADWAHVELGQSGIRVALRERAPGRYVGSYTVRRADRIDPLQWMTVRGAFDGRQVVQNFSYPASFQALATGGPSASAQVTGARRLGWSRAATPAPPMAPAATNAARGSSLSRRRMERA